MFTTRTVTALLVTAGALGVSAVDAQAASTEQFARRADAICRPLEHKLNAIAEPKAPEEVIPYFEQNLKIARPAIKRLRALELPTQKRAQARRAVTYSAKEVTTLQRTVTALKGGADPLATLKAAARKLDAVTKTEDRAWRAVGATDCAK